MSSCGVERGGWRRVRQGAGSRHGCVPADGGNCRVGWRRACRPSTAGCRPRIGCRVGQASRTSERALVRRAAMPPSPTRPPRTSISCWVRVRLYQGLLSAARGQLVSAVSGAGRMGLCERCRSREALPLTGPLGGRGREGRHAAAGLVALPGGGGAGRAAVQPLRAERCSIANPVSLVVLLRAAQLLLGLLLRRSSASAHEAPQRPRSHRCCMHLALQIANI